MGFADLVMKEGERIKIYDIKTSFYGWKPKKKKGEGDQLRLYKRYFAKQYGVNESDIDVEYFIVKRKLYENIDFPEFSNETLGFCPNSVLTMQRRPAISKAFINGKRNPNAEYPAYKTGCTYCPFKKRHDLCNPKQRLVA